jgi:hypothetical protein
MGASIHFLLPPNVGFFSCFGLDGMESELFLASFKRQSLTARVAVIWCCMSPAEHISGRQR